jgi:hypothetical protein
MDPFYFYIHAYSVKYWILSHYQSYFRPAALPLPYLRQGVMKLCGVIALLAFLAISAYAQQAIGVRAGLISCTEGSVYLGDDLLQQAMDLYCTMPERQQLRTGSGRVEMQLGLGAVLRMGANGILRLEDSRLEDVKLLIESGSVLIEIFEKIRGNKVEVHFGNTRMEFREKGLYRIDTERPRLRVYGGKAKLWHCNKKATVKPGKSADLDNSLKISDFDCKQMDSLHRWAARRSFEIFAATAESRNKWNHWVPLFRGWAKNDNFGMSYYSEAIEVEYAQKLKQKQQAEARKEWELWLEQQRAIRNSQPQYQLQQNDPQPPVQPPSQPQ